MKKFLSSIGVLITAFALPIFAHAQYMTSSIELPSSTVPNIESYASSLFSNFQGIITLIIGIILAGILIEIIVGALRK